VLFPSLLTASERWNIGGYDLCRDCRVRNGSAGAVQVRRAEGKLRNLEEAIRLKPLKAAGASATRAGPLTDAQRRNAHPHRDDGKIVVVPNGIVKTTCRSRRS